MLPLAKPDFWFVYVFMRSVAYPWVTRASVLWWGYLYRIWDTGPFSPILLGIGYGIDGSGPACPQPSGIAGNISLLMST